ncbi:MAG: hypothetical protein HYX48_05360 [Chlamydiales bacterium]|nr:hypothetical protein [Chlamydiales bacterium]
MSLEIAVFNENYFPRPPEALPREETSAAPIASVETLPEEAFHPTAIHHVHRLISEVQGYVGFGLDGGESIDLGERYVFSIDTKSIVTMSTTAPYALADQGSLFLSEKLLNLDIALLKQFEPGICLALFRSAILIISAVQRAAVFTVIFLPSLILCTAASLVVGAGVLAGGAFVLAFALLLSLLLGAASLILKIGEFMGLVEGDRRPPALEIPGDDGDDFFPEIPEEETVDLSPGALAPVELVITESN